MDFIEANLPISIEPHHRERGLEAFKPSGWNDWGIAKIDFYLGQNKVPDNQLLSDKVQQIAWTGLGIDTTSLIVLGAESDCRGSLPHEKIKKKSSRRVSLSMNA